MNVGLLGVSAGVDVFGYSSAKHQSIRRALDYVLPFATGVSPWPFNQLHKGEWAQLFRPLRVASRVWGEASYEEVICKLTGMTQAAYDTSSLNLLLPRVFPACVVG